MPLPVVFSLTFFFLKSGRFSLSFVRTIVFLTFGLGRELTHRRATHRTGHGSRPASGVPVGCDTKRCKRWRQACQEEGNGKTEELRRKRMEGEKTRKEGRQGSIAGADEQVLSDKAWPPTAFPRSEGSNSDWRTLNNKRVAKVPSTAVLIGLFWKNWVNFARWRDLKSTTQ